MEKLSIYLRKARNEDCMLLFNWANESGTRENSFSTKAISYTEHKEWFMEKLKSRNSRIFICCMGRELVGQLRIDINGELGILSYSVDKMYRGKGIGNKIIELAQSEGKKLCLRRIKGYVKYSNQFSQKIFERNGFIRVDKEELIEYYKSLN